MISPAAALALLVSAGTPSNICTTQSCVVYAETATDLYQVDPVALTQQHLCAFSGVSGAVNDIAVDASGVLYALTSTTLYRVDPTTCAGTQVATIAGAINFNGLSFLADGRLIAVDDTGAVDQIDPATGAVSSVGSYGGNLGSSGDLVAIASGEVYATAHDNSGAVTDDILVKLDPANGFAAARVGTITGFRQIYGLGYWAGVLYGFDASGQVSKIDPATGAASLAINNALVWYGAGTTPLAPTACTDKCTASTFSCSNAGDLLTCQQGSSGCYDWVASACPSGQSCSNGQCVTTCSSTCVPFTSDCADGTHVRDCALQGNGCFDWAASACPAGQLCSGGSCAPSCTSTCNPGQTQCGAGGVQSCELQGSGCYAFGAATACPAGQVCSNGACATSCSNACTVGAVQCAGSIPQSCGGQAGGCTGWQNGADCGAAGCVNGLCCDCVPGQVRCEATGDLSVCQSQGAGRCPAWTSQPCASHACAGTTCLTACNPSSEVNICPGGEQCVAYQGGHDCGYGLADGGFVPGTGSGSGSGSGTAGSGSTTGAGATTGSGASGGTTGRGTTTLGPGPAAGSTSGSSGSATGGTGGTAGAQGAGHAVTSAGCGCGQSAPSSLFALLAGALVLLGRRRQS